MAARRGGTDRVELSGWIERLGEPAALAVGGLVVGLLFGAAAQQSRFCLRAAAIEFARGTIGAKVAVWLLTFSGAAFGTQALIAGGLLDVSQARQLATQGSLSGALIGGGLFGVGMVLARGCASRLLVLSATGNLRALLSGLLFAVTAQASYRGVLSPLREWLARLWTIEGGAARDIVALVGAAPDWKLMASLALFAAALMFALRAALGARILVTAAATGLSVAGAWWFTYAVAQTSFDPVALKGITFSGPSADMLMLVLSPPGRPLDFDIGLVPGVFLGAFLAAAVTGELALVGFKDGPSMRRYIAGAVLMGFGAMLAGGCAVGAGVTGGAIFATTAWATLAAMWAAAALTDLAVDRDAETATAQPAATPP